MASRKKERKKKNRNKKSCTDAPRARVTLLRGEVSFYCPEANGYIVYLKTELMFSSFFTSPYESVDILIILRESPGPIKGYGRPSRN